MPEHLELDRGRWELELDSRLVGPWAVLLELRQAGGIDDDALDVAGAAIRAAYAIGYAQGRRDPEDELRALYLELLGSDGA